MILYEMSNTLQLALDLGADFARAHVRLGEAMFSCL